jgi:hypothetical protein
VSPDFGVPESALADMLSWAFQQWSAYIESHDLHYAEDAVPAGIVSRLGPVTSGCAGNEDLRVYFGASKPEVESLRPLFLAPYAFTAITSSSAPASDGGQWNQGFLWVAPPTSVIPARRIPEWNLARDPGHIALKSLLLHEVGHVFGNGHITGTVMDAQITQSLEQWTDPATGWAPPAQALSIDRAVDLLPNLNLAETYPLATSYGCIGKNGAETCDDPGALASAFTRLFGHAPAGEVSGTARRLETPHRAHERPEEALENTGTLEVELRDAEGVHQAEIVAQEQVSLKFESAPLLNGQHGDHYESFGTVFAGYAQAQGSKSRIPVVINYNMGDRLTVIDLSAPGGLKHPLLKAQ